MTTATLTTTATITRDINISDYRFVEIDCMDLMTDEDRDEAEAQLDKITLGERLQGKYIDLTQWLCEEEIADYQALCVSWAFKSELESVGIDMDDAEELINDGSIKVKQVWADGYGTQWDINIHY